MPKLTIQSGPVSGSDFSFAERVTIGRAKNVDLCLDHPSVSRRHAELFFKEGDCYVSDLGSANKTYVNGRPLSEATRLLDGDLIAVGAVLVRYRASDTTVTGVRSDTLCVVRPAPKTEHVLLRVPTPDVGLPPALPEQERSARGSEQRLRFLNDLSRMTSDALDENALQKFVLGELLELLPQASRTFMLRARSGSEQVEPAAALTRSGPTTEITISDTIVNEVLRGREAVLIVDSQSDQKYDSSESIRMLHIRSAMAAPLIYRGEVLGILQVDTLDATRPFGQTDIALLVNVASNVAAVIAYARLHARLVEHQLLQHDLLLARKIQQHFLPARPPSIDGYALAVEWRAALGIGGDLYDFLTLGDGIIGIAIGDVSGKGVSAALYAAKIGTELRFQSTGITDAGEILARLNRNVASGVPEGMFVTVALIVLNIKTGRIAMANAGHPLPLVRNNRGEVVEIGGSTGPPLGIIDDVSFEQSYYDMRAGDTVVLYSDGVSEGVNPQGQLFGKERLIESARRADGNAAAILSLALEDLRRFVGTAAQSDDITLICVGRN